MHLVTYTWDDSSSFLTFLTICYSKFQSSTGGNSVSHKNFQTHASAFILMQKRGRTSRSPVLSPLFYHTIQTQVGTHSGQVCAFWLLCVCVVRKTHVLVDCHAAGFQFAIMSGENVGLDIDNEYKSCFARSMVVNSQYGKHTKPQEFFGNHSSEPMKMPDADDRTVRNGERSLLGVSQELQQSFPNTGSLVSKF